MFYLGCTLYSLPKVNLYKSFLIRDGLSPYRTNTFSVFRLNFRVELVYSLLLILCIL